MMKRLIDKIKRRENGILLYGITPPKKKLLASKIESVSQKLIDRIQGLDVDGVILYDIQDEVSRINQKRPFPYQEALDPFVFCERYFNKVDIPKIIYRAVGKYSKEELSHFLSVSSEQDYLSVFVGASSRDQQVSLSLREAYKLRRDHGGSLTLGGVTIPERHVDRNNEHQKVQGKVQQGCSFFISQGVYDVNASKNLLSDYVKLAKNSGTPLVPIIFTFTPCGSMKTLEFMKWLGISVPRWLENELEQSEDILQTSVEQSFRNWLELKNFAAEKGVPIGANVESVSTRKVEVEASIDLLKKIKRSLTTSEVSILSDRRKFLVGDTKALNLSVSESKLN